MLKNGPEMAVDPVEDKINKVKGNQEDFTEIFNKEQELFEINRKQEQAIQVQEGNPDENLNSSLYPDENSVGEWLMDTLDSVSKIDDKGTKSVLMKFLKETNDYISNGDLDSARQNLSYVNDKIKELNSSDGVDKELTNSQITPIEKPIKIEKGIVANQNSVEFRQAVYEAEGIGKSKDLSTAQDKAMMNAKMNLLKANNLNSGKISNVTYSAPKTSMDNDGRYQIVMKIKGDISPVA